MLRENINRYAIMAALACSLILSPPLKADWVPEKPITMMIMSKQGGGMDRASRFFGERLAESLGQPLKYVNRPGASGRKALEEFRVSDADGYTLFSGNIPTLMMMMGLSDTDFIFDFEIAWLGSYLVDPATIVVSSDSPEMSLQEFVDGAKEKPITIGVANFKSVQTLALMQLRYATGMSIEIIPYSGFKGAAKDLIGQHIDAAVGNFSATQKLGDQVRYLGIFADEAPEDVPGLNPIRDLLGVDVIDAASIRSIGVHEELKTAYPDRYKTLRTAFANVLADPDFAKAFPTIGAHPNQVLHWDEQAADAAGNRVLDVLEANRKAFENES